VEVESPDLPARFDFDAIDGGYAWVFPKRRHLSIGVLSFPPQNLNDACENYIRRLGIKPISIERHGYVIPLSPRRGPFVRNNIFLTGDAAGFADPVTAEGITFAIRSGQYAARAIIEQNPPLYDEMVAQLILPELRIARRLAKLLYSYLRTRDMLFSVCGNRLVEAMTRIVTGEASYSSLTSISS
jgi:flavin-dependent dehydrogenase